MFVLHKCVTLHNKVNIIKLKFTKILKIKIILVNYQLSYENFLIKILVVQHVPLTMMYVYQ